MTEQPHRFITTHWTEVLAAKGTTDAGRAALHDLCTAYYQPVRAFLAGRRESRDDADDLTQEFFVRLLERPSLDALQRGRGRFRSYLLGAVKHFLADRRDAQQAIKRGGGRQIVSLDAAVDADGGELSGHEDPVGFPPDAYFDRQWAVTLLGRALDALAAEHAARNQSELFELLKPWLTGDSLSGRLQRVAERLGMTDVAVRMAVHRLRKRFRDLVRQEISRTVAEPPEIETELTYLTEALSHSQS